MWGTRQRIHQAKRASNAAQCVVRRRAERAMREIGSPKVLNLILLGAAVRGGALGLDEADLEAAVRSRIPQKFHELNLRALAWAK